MDSIRLVLTQFTDETISIALAILVLVFCGLIAYWFYNRRKFHQLSHQIPASVVKNYLDSIIANSTALKSSLFRGGGLEVGEGVPSILPTSDLPQGGVSAGGASSEELAQKNAEISNLKSILGQKDATIAELEKMLEAARASNGGGVSEQEYNILKDEMISLKSQLEEANTSLEEAKNDSSGGDTGASEKLNEVTKDRDELKERLMEYEIIEEDLANLKKFQQENEQLKKSIAELKGESASDGDSSTVADVNAKQVEQEEPENEVQQEQVQEDVQQEDQVEEAKELEQEAQPGSSQEPASEEKVEAAAAASESADEISAETSSSEEQPQEQGQEESVDEAVKEDNPEDKNSEGDQKSAAELLSEFEKMLG